MSYRLAFVNNPIVVVGTRVCAVTGSVILLTWCPEDADLLAGEIKMDAVFGANATLIPWVVAAVAALLTLLAIMAALSAARQARAAAHDAERAAAALIDLHREGERLYAAWRADVAALSRIVSALPTASSPQQAQRPPQHAPQPPQHAPQPAPQPVQRPPLVATRNDEADQTVPVMPGASAPRTAVRAPVRAPAPPPPPPVEAVEEEEAPAESTVMLGRGLPPAQPKDQFHGMPVLRVMLGTEPGQEYKLPFEACTIGRASTNRVMLAENKASRVHAEVRYEHNRFTLRDSGSTNGTLRNGSPVTEDVVLEFGDVVAIGKTELLFTCEGFDLKDSDPARAIGAFERLLEREPNFIPGLENLGFLLERDVGRRRDAEGVWKRLEHLKA